MDKDMMRVFLQQYKKASEYPHLLQAMESNLFNLLDKQAEYEQEKNQFMSNLFFQCREKE